MYRVNIREYFFVAIAKDISILFIDNPFGNDRRDHFAQSASSHFSQTFNKMSCYLPLRREAADEGSTSKHTHWRADEQLSQRSKMSYQNEHQPSNKEDDNPDRQMPEENPPQIGCFYWT